MCAFYHTAVEKEEALDCYYEFDDEEDLNEDAVSAVPVLTHMSHSTNASPSKPAHHHHRTNSETVPFTGPSPSKKVDSPTEDVWSQNPHDLLQSLKSTSNEEVKVEIIRGDNPFSSDNEDDNDDDVSPTPPLENPSKPS